MTAPNLIEEVLSASTPTHATRAKVADEGIRAAWQTLLDRKGALPTVEEVLAVTGGNTERVRQICAQCRTEYEGSKRAIDDGLRRQLDPLFARIAAVAMAESDERIRRIQGAHASITDTLARERDVLKGELVAAQAANLKFEDILRRSASSFRANGPRRRRRSGRERPWMGRSVTFSRR